MRSVNETDRSSTGQMGSDSVSPQQDQQQAQQQAVRQQGAQPSARQPQQSVRFTDWASI